MRSHIYLLSKKDYAGKLSALGQVVDGVALHKRFSIFIDKFNDIGTQLGRLNKSFNAAVGSAQSRLLPQGRRFAELAGQSGEMDLSDQIDEVVREIQAGD